MVVFSAQADDDLSQLDDQYQRLRSAIVDTFDEGLPLGATEVVGQPPWLKFEIRPYTIVFTQMDREGLGRLGYPAPRGYYVGRVVPRDWIDSQFRLGAEQAEEHYEVGVVGEEADEEEVGESGG